MTTAPEAVSAREPASDPLATGARNLLRACAEVRPGQRVLLVQEDPALGWYDTAAPQAVAREGLAMGASVQMLAVGGPDQPPPPALAKAQAEADVEIFFARLGDQDRFCPRDPGRRTVVSYARTAAALASDFGRRAHGEMLFLKASVDARLHAAAELRVRCPLGTELIGRAAPGPAQDVTIRRFPMCVPAPVLAAGFSGRVVLAGHLYPTGSQSYQPRSVALSGPVSVRLEAGRITGLDGRPEDMTRIRRHYERLAQLFDIDPWICHSWHAGLHPGCTAPIEPEMDPDRWANSVFGSPGWLHFHTCGAYAPGEVCWMVAQPTITADGVALWQDGRLVS
ncbi:MAG: hypothetical protein AAGC57_09265 [Pseudomonadota bacterium]